MFYNEFFPFDMTRSLSVRISRNLFLGVLVLLFLYEASYIFWRAGHAYRNFKAAGWNYDERRHDFAEALPYLTLKRFLPETSLIDVPARGWDIENVAAKYFLYPIRFQKGGNYILTHKDDASQPPSNWQNRSLPRGMNVYAKPGYGFADQTRRNSVSLPLGMTFIWVCVFAVFNILIGLSFLKTLEFPLREGVPLWIWGCSYLLGFLLLSVSLLVLAAAGRGLIDMNIILIVWVAVIWMVYIVKQTVWADVFSGGGRISLPDRIPLACFKENSLHGFLIFVLIAVIIISVFTPVVDWDGMAHWIMKSKIMACQHRLDFSYTHNNYHPILWPVYVAVQFIISGGIHDQFAKWTSAFLFVVFAGFLWQGFRAVSGKGKTATLFTLVFVVLSFRVPVKDFWFYNYIHANAENLFLSFLTGVTLAVMLWIRSREKCYLSLAVFFGAGLSLTKLEGAATVLLLAVPLWVLFKKLKMSKKEIQLLSALSFSVLLLVLWVLWVNLHGYGEATLHAGSGVTWEKAGILTHRLTDYILHNQFILLNLIFFGAALVVPRNRLWTVSEKYLLFSSVLLILFSCLAMAGWPAEKLKSTSLEVFQRLFLHAAPVVAFFCVSRFSGDSKESAEDCC